MSSRVPAALDRAYADPSLVRGLVRRLESVCAGQPPRTIMEVCGTHTMSIFRHGIRSLLPAGIRLISGPGCPVCVTPASYLDFAIELSRRDDVVVATFGDLIRVPGSHSTLERQRARGADIRVVYAPFDAVELAASLGKDDPRIVVFLAVGFETTSPAVAQAVLEAERLGLRNFRVLVAHRRVVPALEALLRMPELRLDGFLLPGHVSVIIGSDAYRFLEDRGVGGVVAGFEPVDVLRSLVVLAEQARDGRARVENHYTRAVTPSGNLRALQALEKVFAPADADWRGLGRIPASGLALRPELARFDASALLDPEVQDRLLREVRDDTGCRCGEVLSGTIPPTECEHFGAGCTPEIPIGPCMVSTEGTCAAYYKYGG